MERQSCAFPSFAVSDKRPEGAKGKSIHCAISRGYCNWFSKGGTDTDCIQHQHTPLSAGDASPRQGHGQLLVRVVSTLEWWRNLSTAGFTQLKPERRSTKSGLWVWTPGLLNPAGMERCWLRVRKAPSGAASSADRDPASPPGDPDHRRKMPAIGNYRISSIMRWKDRGDGRSSTTLMCKSCFGMSLVKHVDSVCGLLLWGVHRCSCAMVFGAGGLLWSFSGCISFFIDGTVDGAVRG